MGEGFTVAVHHRDGVVVLVAQGDVRADAAALRDLLGVALHALDDQPAVIAVCDLYVQHADGLAALRWLLRQRPIGSPTVVIARSAQRRRLQGVFGAQVPGTPPSCTPPGSGSPHRCPTAAGSSPASGAPTPVRSRSAGCCGPRPRSAPS